MSAWPHLWRDPASLFTTTNPSMLPLMRWALQVAGLSNSFSNNFLMDLSVAMERSTRNQGSPDPDKQAFQLIMACARGQCSEMATRL